MNIIIEEIVSEFPVVITEEVVQIKISDATSYFDLIEVADTDFEGKEGFVSTVENGKLKLKEPTGTGGGIPEAPNNANAYVRKGLAWVVGYTKTTIDYLLGTKFNNPTGDSSQYLDGAGLATTFPTIPTTPDGIGALAINGSNASADVDLGIYNLFAQQLRLRNPDGQLGVLQVDNLTTNRSIQFQDKDYIGVADITDIPTNTSQLTNNGSDGVNPFITALDIPTTGQASTLVREVKNMTGATLTKGTVVYISGANGNKPLVSKAKADAENTSARTFGLIQSNILNNGLGYCVIIGDLSGLDTSSFTDGDQLYLSGVNAGTFTSTKTLAPTHLVYIGKVTRSHPTQGQIEVQIQNGYELNEIHDVAISSVADKQLLSYDSATSLWKNKSVTTTDISDSTNKRYQTDNQNTFNDATSSIQTQLNGKQPSLGFTPYRYISSTASSTVAGTLTETQVLQVTIPPNSFASLDLFKIPALKVFKTGIIGTAQIKIKLTTSNTMPSGTTSQIASFTTIAANLSIPMKRTFSVRSNVLSGYGNGSVSSDEVVINNPPSTFTFDPTVVNYLYVSITLSNIADSAYLDQFQLTNI